ncbi:DUF3991 and TOPRIM domain-containing protein [Caproiciproducens sp. CPB-2]|uniref:DUF3991 and TOPRIM domain-containing protein n=1 Tax=Caproiciproducens sp. CPB-2 TaxID=3030017 RepID=UPI0023DC8E4B|nr:DUF3991 and TOPRIM domain-containing protein [Caproiciproducens sp. CPB-2]MDF1494561.1 DUF3991 and TOPRIM domain-containing protein [Caproiciproducens sp. CPB-2]
MPYIDPEVILEAKQMDLLTYLQNYEPKELVHFSGNVYCTRTHDSLKISNGKWCWHSRGIGGRSALDYLIKVNGMSFTEAVEQIMGQAAIKPPVFMPKAQKLSTPFALPPMDKSITEVERYLMQRGISRELIRYCVDSQILYQTRKGEYCNAVFVGCDKDRIPRYASIRGISGDFKGDVTGSDKRYSFALPNGGKNLHLFESAIDLLSFATLKAIQPQHGYDGDLLSLSGVYKPKQNIEDSALPPALTQYLKGHPEISHIHLHLDNDLAGRLATKAIVAVLPNRYAVTDEPPPSGKDYNDYLCDCLNLPRTHVKERNYAR